ncbi:hypothetical protein DESUT3_05250 [Desulfuromonas versatilis]|uniref:Type II secretion system protein GspF domain-containing protein n=1 Tax=Desulfuromonas versatilis TaxID=2802975 RepID=A0ABM8HPC5_9BACT|nr:type II secretion system F family protein [Desulfuromonas versatilis]BCR03456.1 hypothetical protein DESUT3_05250 [Desulfuromonas versatilis]
MDLLTVLLLTCVFLFAASLVGIGYLWLAGSGLTHKRSVRRRLLYLSAGGALSREKLALYKKEALQDAGILERLLFALPRISALDRMLIRAGLPLNASTFLLGSLGLALAGYLVAAELLSRPAAGFACGLLMLVLPFLYLRHVERKVLARFEDQLPDALDFLARALRSGHALTSGFEMVSGEMGEPLKAEFAAVVDEVNLGISVREALENLCRRVPLRDLRFFVVAILVQRETGGNIADIFDNISHLIRERAKFHRLVRTLTADGRLSSVILFLMPIVLFGYIYLVNYEYLSLLWTEKAGVLMMATASLAMVLGALVMSRIVKIEM